MSDDDLDDPMKTYGKPPSGRLGLRADKIGRLQAELREVEDRMRTTGNPAQLPNFRVRRQTIIDELRALGDRRVICVACA